LKANINMGHAEIVYNIVDWIHGTGNWG
jgi:hypothetical protein